MTTQEENEQIMEKLLGWHKDQFGDWWRNDPEAINWMADAKKLPTFTTWAEAGLILDAFAKAGFRRIGLVMDRESCAVFERGREHIEGYGADLPAAIRAAALAYLETLKG
jgi:hypothetical protein